jgi:acyl-CoA synthetase (AMP-forming)/AMP-acid ligase II
MVKPGALPARICAIPRAIAARTPDAPALIEAGRRCTYAELVRRIDTYARLLRELGVRAGDRVMIVGENSVAQVALMFACASIDAWMVNANARLSAHELAGIRAHSGARRVFYTAAVSAQAAAHATRDGATAHGELMAGPLNTACAPEPVSADGDQVAALLYTTGTTGQPKGVMLTHRNLLFVATVSSRLRGLMPSDLAYGALPISHVYGLASVMLGTLTAGACLQLEPAFSAQALLRAISDDGLTIVQGVPAMYARLLELFGERAAALPSRLRFCYAGGSPLDPMLKRAVERLLGLPLHNGYGLTESAPTVSQTRLDAPRADTSVGFAIPGVELRLFGRDGHPVSPGSPGELWVRGPNVMKGYYREAQLTDAVLSPDGWLNTGDMARQEADGALFIVGRTKELIIRSGFNVFPLEVETVLNAHPAVTQSAVVGCPAGDGNEEVVAFVEPDPNQALDIDALRAWAAERLAPYKRPSRIVVMPALPAAATGKVLKSRLKEWLAQALDVPPAVARAARARNA